MDNREATKRSVHRTLVALILAFAGTQAHADSVVQLASVEQGWELSFFGPDLHTVAATSSPDNYHYFGKTKDGLFLSLHVESRASDQKGTASCLADFHPDYASARWNLPDFVDRTSVTFSDSAFSELSYTARLNYRDHLLPMPNVHFFFEINGRCADLHMAAQPGFDTPERTFNQYVEQVRQSLIKSTPETMQRLVKRERPTFPVASTR